MNRCRSAIAVLAVVFAVLPGGRADAFDLDMRWGHVTTYWDQINAVVLSIAEHNALDFDWLDKLQAMTPPDGKGKTAADVSVAIEAFRAKLDMALDSDHVVRQLVETFVTRLRRRPVIGGPVGGGG